MRLCCLTLYFLFPLSFLFAQDTTAIHYAVQIKPDELRSYLQVLSSDSLEGRETGMPGQKRAAKFIANHFQSLGLEPVSHGTYLQDVSLSINANKGNNFEVNQKFYLYMKDYFYPPGLSDTIFSIDSIVFAGYGINIGTDNYNDYSGINVKGRTVIVYEGKPKAIAKKLKSWNNWTWIINEAEVQKPFLILIITDSLEKIIDQFNYSKTTVFGKELHYAFITREMARSFLPEINEEKLQKARNKIDKKGKPQSFVSSSSAKLHFVSETERLKGQNVVAYLEGTDKKDELLVITAHYDHLGKKYTVIYHGADDDGSGTSAVMELAKVFTAAKREGHGPRRSILFMTVSGEEKGLLGSSYYVNHPLFPLSHTIADLNIDMIGRTDPKHDSLGIRNYLYIIGSDKLSTQLHRINESANSTYSKLDLDYSYNSPADKNRFYYRSDHYNFAKNNIPIIFYFNGTHADYHRPTDTIDKIDFDLLARRTKLVFFTAWDLANRDERIKVDVKNNFEDEKK